MCVRGLVCARVARLFLSLCLVVGVCRAGVCVFVSRCVGEARREGPVPLFCAGVCYLGKNAKTDCEGRTQHAIPVSVRRASAGRCARALSRVVGVYRIRGVCVGVFI